MSYIEVGNIFLSVISILYRLDRYIYAIRVMTLKTADEMQVLEAKLC